jgi:ketosteroid isomerase-like protein
MAASNARIVLGDACALWTAGDLPRLLSCFVDDVVFSVHSRPPAASLVGEGLGKVLFAHRLEMLLDEVEVLAFDLQSVTTVGLWHYSRVRYRYRHHVSRMVIDGTMRHKFAFVGNKIAHFELFHDAHRMRAFYDMAGLVACGA